MKKKNLIFVLMIFLIFILLSGCSEEKKDNKENISNKFTGIWTGGMYNGSGYNSNDQWEFFTNGSLKQIKDYESEFASVEWFTYEIDNTGNLCLEQPEISYLMCFIIKFEDNDSTCMLSLGEEIPMFRLQKT